MKFIAFISLCATLAASTPSGFPMTRLTGQFSGLGEPVTRLPAAAGLLTADGSRA